MGAARHTRHRARCRVFRWDGRESGGLIRLQLRDRNFRNPGRWANMNGFPSAEPHMQDINPIANGINDLKGRVASLRGYL